MRLIYYDYAIPTYRVYRLYVIILHVYRCDFLWLLFSEGAHPMKPQTGRSNTHTLQLASTTCTS